jgi:hypothetical protein
LVLEQQRRRDRETGSRLVEDLREVLAQDAAKPLAGY